MKYRFSLEVEAPDSASPDEVAHVLNNLLNVGLSDAEDTYEDDELDSEEAALAIQLEIGQPTEMP